MSTEVPSGPWLKRQSNDPTIDTRPFKKPNNDQEKTFTPTEQKTENVKDECLNPFFITGNNPLPSSIISRILHFLTGKDILRFSVTAQKMRYFTEERFLEFSKEERMNIDWVDCEEETYPQKARYLIGKILEHYINDMFPFTNHFYSYSDWHTFLTKVLNLYNKFEFPMRRFPSLGHFISQDLNRLISPHTNLTRFGKKIFELKEFRIQHTGNRLLAALSRLLTYFECAGSTSFLTSTHLLESVKPLLGQVILSGATCASRLAMQILLKRCQVLPFQIVDFIKELAILSARNSDDRCYDLLSCDAQQNPVTWFNLDFNTWMTMADIKMKQGKPDRAKEYNFKAIERLLYDFDTMYVSEDIIHKGMGKIPISIWIHVIIKKISYNDWKGAELCCKAAKKMNTQEIVLENKLLLEDLTTIISNGSEEQIRVLDEETDTPEGEVPNTSSQEIPLIKGPQNNQDKSTTSTEQNIDKFENECRTNYLIWGNKILNEDVILQILRFLSIDEIVKFSEIEKKARYFIQNIAFSKEFFNLEEKILECYLKSQSFLMVDAQVYPDKVSIEDVLNLYDRFEYPMQRLSSSVGAFISQDLNNIINFINPDTHLTTHGKKIFEWKKPANSKASGLLIEALLQLVAYSKSIQQKKENSDLLEQAKSNLEQAIRVGATGVSYLATRFILAKFFPKFASTKIMSIIQDLAMLSAQYQDYRCYVYLLNFCTDTIKLIDFTNQEKIEIQIYNDIIENLAIKVTFDIRDKNGEVYPPILAKMIIRTLKSKIDDLSKKPANQETRSLLNEAIQEFENSRVFEESYILSEFWLEAALIMKKLKEMEKAEKYIDKALLNFPKKAPCQFLQAAGIIKWKCKKWDVAEQYLEQALLKQDNPDTYNYYTSYSLFYGKTKDDISNIYPTINPKIFHILGQIKKEKGKFQEAEKYFNDFIELTCDEDNPSKDDFSIYIDFANIKHELGKKIEEQKYFFAAIHSLMIDDNHELIKTPSIKTLINEKIPIDMWIKLIIRIISNSEMILATQYMDRVRDIYDPKILLENQDILQDLDRIILKDLEPQSEDFQEDVLRTVSMEDSDI